LLTPSRREGLSGIDEKLSIADDKLTDVGVFDSIEGKNFSNV